MVEFLENVVIAQEYTDAPKACLRSPAFRKKGRF